MKTRIYLSGWASHLESYNRDPEDRSKHIGPRWCEVAGVTHRCLSYVWIRRTGLKGFHHFSKPCLEDMLIFRRKGGHTMLDSGVVSIRVLMEKAIRSGKHFAEFENRDGRLNLVRDGFKYYLRQYTRYCLRNQKYHDNVVTVDWRMNCAEIYKITSALRKAGVTKVMPIYHGDASIDWFQRYIDEGYPWIGIQLGNVKRTSGQRRNLYDDLFNRVAKAGREVKTHGFAMTSPEFIYDYPFYSVDSATWIKHAAFGRLALPNAKGRLIPCIASSRSSEVPQDTMRGMLAEYCKSHPLGFTPEQLMDDWVRRAIWNAWMYQNMGAFTAGRGEVKHENVKTLV